MAGSVLMLGGSLFAQDLTTNAVVAGTNDVVVTANTVEAATNTVGATTNTLEVATNVVAATTNAVPQTDSIKQNEVIQLSAQADEAFQKNDFALALKDYSKVLELDSNNVVAYYARGWTQQRMGDDDAALADFDQAMQYCTNDLFLAGLFLSRGEVNYRKKAFEPAVADCTQAIRTNPKFEEAYITRARIFNSMKRYDRAVIDCNMAIWLKPASAEAYYLRGQADENIQELGKALDDFDQAIHLNGTNDVYYLARAVARNINRDYNAALADCDMALGLNPHYADACASKGQILLELGKYADAVIVCKQAITLNTNSYLAYNNLAWILAVAPDEKIRDGGQAVLYAQQACEMSRWKSAYCLGTLAAACAEAGKFDEAVKYEQQCIIMGLSDKDLAQANKELELFKQNKPYHLEH